jgi:hypothetical protein
MPAGFTKPYLRMPLRTKRPNQHSLLLDLESKGNLVAYATPNFWTTEDLDTHFISQRVHLETCYFSPTDIGLLDDKSHYVAYCPGMSDAWVFSVPHQFKGHFRPHSFGERITAAVKEAEKQEPLGFLETLRNQIVELTGRDVPTLSPTHSPKVESRVSRAAREVAYLAQVRLGCAFADAGRQTPPSQRPQQRNT